jgi:hypothetical protein
MAFLCRLEFIKDTALIADGAGDFTRHHIHIQSRLHRGF